jgi:BirA family transcriptional regulator, biotin operon repressor / biotin---[acetyl-CoA-carboxylase] ligase
VTSTTFDIERQLERRLDLPRVVWFETVGSTLDVAHQLAEDGAAAGTLILANAQTAGRGRFGRTWRSEAGAGIWMTLIERPADVTALDVLPLRIGVALARSLAEFSDAAIRVKWPNDVYAGAKKIAGILVEARWRNTRPAWLAIGVGINLRLPVGEQAATALRAETSRDVVLAHVVPLIRSAAARPGLLDDTEVASLAALDLARGRECTEPMAGRVRGIDATGSLLIDDGRSTIAVRTGSLVLKEAP